MEHLINFNYTAPYYTLNKLTAKTTDVWIVCHGFGQLAEHFVRRFDVLDFDKNFVIAPQGLSRFYMDNYQKVGASWMTRLNKEIDIDNQRQYFDVVMDNALQGRGLDEFRVHLLGFSQGVAMVCRMVAYSRINFRNLILWAGGFPQELKATDFAHLGAEAKVTVVAGDQDEFVRFDERFDMAVKQAESALGRKIRVVRFDGGHEMKREVLRSLID